MMSRFSVWLGRLSVGRKLMLIYLLDLTAVIFVSGLLISEKLDSIDFTRKEVVGTAYVEAVRQNLMAELVLPHATQAQVLQARERLAAVRSAHDAALQSAEVSANFVRTLPDEATARALRSGAPALLPLIAERHLVDSARTLLTTVANQSNLILDPDLDSYYVMSITALRFPELVQVLHEGRVLTQQLGAVDGRRGARQVKESQLLTLAGRVDAVRQGIEADYVQAYVAGGAPLKQALQAGQAGLLAQLQTYQVALSQLAEADMPLPQDLAGLADAHQAALQAVDNAWAQGLVALTGLLHARVDGLFARMWLHLGTALVLLGCILSLVTLVARQIAKPLQQLARVADEVRKSGDHTLRAQWNSRDEIGRLVTAFNEMLSQLDRDRVLQQELAASARAAEAQRELVEAFPIPMVVTSIPEHEVLHSNAPAAQWLGGRKTRPLGCGAGARRARALLPAPGGPGLGR
jgi:HAMP domain-containing protein